MVNRHFGSWAATDCELSGLQQVVPFRTSHTHYIHVESKLVKDMEFKYIFMVFQCKFGYTPEPQGLAMNCKP